MSKYGWTTSDELNGIPLGTAQEERRRAELWMNTAADYARSAEYYKIERDKLLIKYDPDSPLLDNNI